MKTMLSLAIVLSFAGSARPDEVLLAEDFDAGFDGSGWSTSNIYGDGSWMLDASVAFSGPNSLKQTGAFGNFYLSYDLGTSMENTRFSAWFYDGMEPTKETFVSVSSDPGHLTWTNQHLKIGTTCAYSPDRYTIAEGWHADGYVVGPLRTEGWHRAVFENVNGVNTCYIDGVVVHQTVFQGNWRYAILNEDSHCLTGSSWFDHVLVVRPATVPTRLLSWSAVKGQFLR